MYVNEVEKPKRKYVLAYSYRQFVSWCEENKINPRDNTKAVYIDGATTLRGTIKPEVIRYGLWFERKDLKEIEQEISSRWMT